MNLEHKIMEAGCIVPVLVHFPAASLHCSEHKAGG